MLKTERKRGIIENGNSTPVSKILSFSGYTMTKTFSNGEDLLEYVRRIADPELVPEVIVTDLAKRGGKSGKRIIVAI